MKSFISHDLVGRDSRVDKHDHFTLNNILPFNLFIQNINNNKKYLKKDKRRSDPREFCYRDQSFINRMGV